MTPECVVLEPRWSGPIIVAATGETLTKHVAAACVASGCPIIAIKEASLRIPTADVLYACDAHHWKRYEGYPNFRGEKWSSHSSRSYDNKLEVAEKYSLRLVRGVAGKTFSVDPSFIHYGNSTGFQAIGLAIHWMRKPGRIVLVGFDMRGEYFFGHHPRGRALANFGPYMPFFETAAKSLPEGVEIVNCSPNTALECFPKMLLEDVLIKKAA